MDPGVMADTSAVDIKSPVRWPFAAKDTFAQLAEHHRLPLVHSLPGMLVWPILLLFLGTLFAMAAGFMWGFLGGMQSGLPLNNLVFAAVSIAYAVLAGLMWAWFRQYDAHHRAFAILPLRFSDFWVGFLVLAFVLTIGSNLSRLFHDFAMLDTSMTLAGGATTEDVSNIDEFTAVGADMWAIVLLTVIAAPIVEEILFRGWMLPMLRARGVPVLFAILISALAFGLVHTHQGLMVMTSTFFLGIALGVARVATGRVAAPVLGHMANNAWAVFIVPELLRMQAG